MVGGNIRLDSAVAARQLARSRSQAARLIAAGLVTVNGSPELKPATQVGPNDRIEVAGADHYVSRGAHKLIAALDAFDIPVADRIALDAGASTGGFSQVLLERGARHVLALDVGHGQLAAELAADARLTSVEGCNIRDLTPEWVRERLGGATPTLVVADLSFISLTLALPPLRASVAADADFVLLVKPQFEVGRTGIREGIVQNPALRDQAISTVLWAAWDLGLTTAGVIASPIAGGAGNREYLVWLNATHGSIPAEWAQRITALASA